VGLTDAESITALLFVRSRAIPLNVVLETSVVVGSRCDGLPTNKCSRPIEREAGDANRAGIKWQAPDSIRLRFSFRDEAPLFVGAKKTAGDGEIAPRTRPVAFTVCVTVMADCN